MYTERDFMADTLDKKVAKIRKIKQPFIFFSWGVENKLFVKHYKFNFGNNHSARASKYFLKDLWELRVSSEVADKLTIIPNIRKDNYVIYKRMTINEIDEQLCYIAGLTNLRCYVQEYYG